MPRIQPVDREQADPRSRELLDQVQKKLGGTPNIFRTFAQSPAVLDFYLQASGALGNASLSPGLREQIALTVAGANTCDYCAAAHSKMAEGYGVEDAERDAALEGKSSDPRTQSALTFARAIVDREGFVTDDHLQDIRDAGYSDAEVVEIVAVVALNIFTNYFNHVAQTAVDFPRVELPAATT